MVQVLAVLLMFAMACMAQGPTLPISAGGTGANSAAQARTNLGAAAEGSGGVPSGMIVFIKTGTCPAGWTEETTLAGFYVLATKTANGDVGTTGGSNSYTPAGTASVTSLTAAAQTFTGDSTTVPGETVNSLTAAAQTFTGNSVASSLVSAGTPAGTNSTVSFTPSGTVAYPINVPLFSGTGGTVPAQTFTGSSGTVSAATIAWPAGVPTHSGTTATFSGSALATHSHELPWQIPSTTTIRQIAIATFGTGTSRAATAVSGAGTANTTSAPVALSQAVSAGTPAGTVNITSQGTVAWPAGVPTNGTTSFTPTGTNSTAAFTPAGSVAWPVNPPTFAGSSGTVGAQTFTGSALGTHQHTTTATGTNGTSAVTGTLNSTTVTPLGHNASSSVTGTLGFSGTPATITQPYIKLIACSKN